MTRTTTQWPDRMTGGDDWRARARVRGRELLRAWAELLAPVPWQFFATLTFDVKMVLGVNAALASKEAFWWCGQVGRLLRRPVGWVFAVEHGRGGACHVHALLVGVPGELGKAPAAMWEQRNGGFHVRPVDDTRRGVLYTTKEAAMSGEIVFSDTLGRYRPRAAGISRVDIHPVSDQRPPLANYVQQQVAVPMERP